MTQHPDTPTGRLMFARSLDRRGVDALARGEYEEACREFVGSLAIRQELLGLDHEDVALSFANVGAVLRKLGQHQRAQMHEERALEIRSRLEGEGTVVRWRGAPVLPKPLMMVPRETTAMPSKRPRERTMEIDVDSDIVEVDDRAQPSTARALLREELALPPPPPRANRPS